MKGTIMKWVIIAVIIIAVALLIYFEQSWQVISVVGAALAGPLKYIFSLFSKSEEDIREKHAKIREQEKKYQILLESRVKEKEKSIEELESRLQELEQKRAELDLRRKRISQEVEKMSLEELQDLGEHYFGS